MQAALRESREQSRPAACALEGLTAQDFLRCKVRTVDDPNTHIELKTLASRHSACLVGLSAPVHRETKATLPRGCKSFCSRKGEATADAFEAGTEVQRREISTEGPSILALRPYKEWTQKLKICRILMFIWPKTEQSRSQVCTEAGLNID